MFYFNRLFTLLEYKEYPIYRQEIVKYIDSIIPPTANNILVFGDKFYGLEYKWSKSFPQRKVANLDLLYKDWSYISDNNPQMELPLEKNSFDTIVAYHGLEKSLDPQRLILQLRKALISNGKFIFITYNSSHIYSLYTIMIDELISVKDGAFKEGNIQHFSYNQLKYLYEDTGLEVEKEDIYAIKDHSTGTKQLLRITENPYITALSLIFICNKIETFPFFESVYL